MNKPQAAEALGISLRTLERRMQEKKVTFTRGDGQFDEVSFTYADLGLPEPSAESAERPEAAPSAVCVEVASNDKLSADRSPEVTAAPSLPVVDKQEHSPTNEEILREAESRGCLIAGHPDLKPVSVSIDAPRYVAARPFHAPTAKASDWRTAKAPEQTGYTSPVDDPEWLNMIHFKGTV